MGDKKNWGGKRPNSGSPKIENSRRINIQLTESQIKTAFILGDGVVSIGVRMALEIVTNTLKTEKE
jgi:hypothetical protein